jgi:hypothetical protein
MIDFKVGELVEELDPPGGIEGEFPRSQGLIVRVCLPDEHPGFHNRQVVEVQWLATGHQTLQFNGNLRRTKR